VRRITGVCRSVAGWRAVRADYGGRAGASLVVVVVAAKLVIEADPCQSRAQAAAEQRQVAAKQGTRIKNALGRAVHVGYPDSH
jgi:hypothetical protein